MKLQKAWRVPKTYFSVIAHANSWSGISSFVSSSVPAAARLYFTFITGIPALAKLKNVNFIRHFIIMRAFVAEKLLDI